MTSAMGAGVFISATGMSTVLMVGSSALSTLGCGLCYLLGLDTSTGVWIGLQIVAGFGLGGGFQVPVMVGQTTVQGVDIAAITAMTLCFQTVGGAIWLSATQSIFVNQMLASLPRLAPGVDPMLVVATSAGQLRNVFGPDQLRGVIAAYLEGIRAAFMLACAVVGTSMLIGLFIPWKKLNTSALKEAGGGGFKEKSWVWVFG